MWRHRCAGGLWRSCTYGRAPNAIDISQGSVTCPSYTDTGPSFLYCYSDTPPHLVAFYDMLGIRRTYSRLQPPAWLRITDELSVPEYAYGPYCICFHYGRLEDLYFCEWLSWQLCECLKIHYGNTIGLRTKRRRSDPVLLQKPLYQQKCQRDKVTTQTTPQKRSIKQQSRTDLGRSVGVTTATQLVWLTGLRAHLPTPRNSRVIKRTHI